MLHTNLYLREPTSDKETPVILRLFCGGVRMKYATLITIHPQLWDAKKQRIKPSRKLPHHLELNAYLEKLQHVSAKAFWEYKQTNDGQSPSLNELKVILDKKLARVKEVEKVNFFGFFEKLIEQSSMGIRLNPQNGKPINPSTTKTYVTTLNHLREYQRLYQRNLDFKDINLEFYNNYTEFLIKDLKLSINTIGKNIQVIKLIMNEAVEVGATNNVAHISKRFITVKENSDSIYLGKKELNEIEVLDLTAFPKLERVRDLFLIGCYTGLRYSDYSILKPEDIRNGFIQVTQVKTDSPVTIPLHDTVVSIIHKYNNSLPASISNQKTNDYLKEIGKMVPSLQVEVSKSFTKEGTRQQTKYQKWEMLTSHTARRSFATNEYLAGTPTLTIMAITGHKTEKAFLRYIKLTSSEHAKLLKEHWEKRKLAAI